MNIYLLMPFVVALAQACRFSTAGHSDDNSGQEKPWNVVGGEQATKLISEKEIAKRGKLSVNNLILAAMTAGTECWRDSFCKKFVVESAKLAEETRSNLRKSVKAAVRIVCDIDSSFAGLKSVNPKRLRTYAADLISREFSGMKCWRRDTRQICRETFLDMTLSVVKAYS